MAPIPPVGFPLYGLAQSWGGARWLDFFDAEGAGSGPDRVALPTEAVWLGQGDSFRPMPGHPWSVVGTLTRQRRVAFYDDPDAVFADIAAFKLVSLTAPVTGGDQTSNRLLLHHAKSVGEDLANWPTASWTVDNRPVQAHLWHWADCWVGVVLELSDVAVEVIGHGFAPHDIALTTVSSDDVSYGFDIGAPLNFHGTIDQSWRAAFGPGDVSDTKWPMHQDHIELPEGQPTVPHESEEDDTRNDGQA